MAIQGQYSWQTAKGELIANLENRSVTLKKEQSSTSMQELGLPWETPPEKVHDVFATYLPLIKGSAVTFHECTSPYGEARPVNQEEKDGAQDKSFEFTFNRLEHIKQVQFSKDAPDYCRVIRGLNLEGICGNAVCIAHKKIVIIPIGYGDYNIGQLQYTSQCPACDTGVDSEKVKNLGFWDCHYTIEGKQQAKEEKIEKQDTAPKEHYRTFKQEDDCSWAYLQVTAKKIGSEERVSKCNIL